MVQIETETTPVPVRVPKWWRAVAAARSLAVGMLTATMLAMLWPGIGAYAQDSNDVPLRVELRADDQSVLVTLRNEANVPVSFLSWGTAFGGILDADVLQIRDTEVLPPLNFPLPYTGLLLKRSEPQARNLVTVGAGQFVTVRVTPGDYYALDVSSSYQVEYSGEILYTTADVSAGDHSQSIRPLLQSASLQSNSVQLPLQVPPEIRAAVAPGYSACSVSQQATLQSALNAAESLAVDAATGLNSLGIGQRSNSPRYTQWFGAYSETRFNIVSTGFRSLQSALENNRINFVCSCTRDQTYAFVNRGRPFEINLCPYFWLAPETGTDSRAGTIIHELSHFNEVIGTADFKYGQRDVAALAITNPDQSVLNADSYEYFAENTPALSIVGASTGSGVIALPLDTTQSGSLAEKQSQYYSVTGARSIELTSVSGDADLSILRSVADQTVFCESNSTAVVEACDVDTLPTAIVRVFGYTDSEYRVVARSGIVTVQGGNTGAESISNPVAQNDDNAGSMGVTLMLLVALAGIRRALRSGLFYRFSGQLPGVPAGNDWRSATTR